MTDCKIVGVTNVLQHISFPVAILISLLSWGLGIPVDYRGLATYKNHFFHSLNTLSCAAAMLVLDQDWRSGSLVLPFRYGLAYALSQFVLQRLGDKNHKYFCDSYYMSGLACAGQPVLYPFLDFSAAPGLAVCVVLGCAALLPLIHTALCHAADRIQERRDRASGHY